MSRTLLSRIADRLPSRAAAVRCVVGVVLLAAAGLKLYGLGVSAVPRVGWFAQPWVQLAAAEWELALGLWLLSGAYRLGSWAAALATFLAFAGISGYLGTAGVASCGCFGTIHASPWWAFAVDALSIVLLLISRPCGEPKQVHKHGFGIFWVPLLAVVTCGLIVAGSSIVSGSIEMGLARVQGEPLSVDPSYLDLGDLPGGTVVLKNVTIHNFTSEPIHLLGGTIDCTCATTAGLPSIVPAHGTLELPVRIVVPQATQGQFTRSAEIWTNSARRPTLRFLIGCNVTPPGGDRSN